jgi:hypothetical protein
MRGEWNRSISGPGDFPFGRLAKGLLEPGPKGK